MTTTQTKPVIGDLQSTEKGSGARFNADKLPLHLIPLYQQVAFYEQIVFGTSKTKRSALGVLHVLSTWEQGIEPTRSPLLYALSLADPTLEYSAKVFSYGASKYVAWNWAKGMAWSVPIGCIARHARQILLFGEDIDPESNLPHLGHIGCNLLMLDHYERFYAAGDDRPPAKLFTS
jgi:hypothetical protein